MRSAHTDRLDLVPSPQPYAPPEATVTLKLSELDGLKAGRLHFIALANQRLSDINGLIKVITELRAEIVDLEAKIKRLEEQPRGEAD